MSKLSNQELRLAVQRRNHPAKGSSIKVEPIRHRNEIESIKNLLRGMPRNLCLFTLGINTALRAGELLSLSIGDVAHLEAGESFDLKQAKNNQYRRVSLNKVSKAAIEGWLAHHPAPELDAPLFISQKRGAALSVSAVNQLVKTWCAEIGLGGNYGSHSLRKTWGYHQRIERGTSVALLMRAFGHASEAQTLEYLCIQPDELAHLYLELEL